MLICHCKVISDSQIRQALSEGAKTVGQVGRACGAGTCCGGCVPAISELIEVRNDRVAERNGFRSLPVTHRRSFEHAALAAE